MQSKATTNKEQDQSWEDFGKPMGIINCGAFTRKLDTKDQNMEEYGRPLKPIIIEELGRKRNNGFTWIIDLRFATIAGIRTENIEL